MEHVPAVKFTVCAIEPAGPLLCRNAVCTPSGATAIVPLKAEPLRWMPALPVKFQVAPPGLYK